MTHNLIISSRRAVGVVKRGQQRACYTAGMGMVASRARGFTLLELVVALSVFALGLTGVVTLNNNALLATANAARMQEASYLAERHLNALQLNSEIVVGDYAGTFQGLSPSVLYPWQLRVRRLDSAPLQPQLLSFPQSVVPLELYLVVRVAEGSRPLEFHSLVVMPSEEPIDHQVKSIGGELNQTRSTTRRTRLQP